MKTKRNLNVLYIGLILTSFMSQSSSRKMILHNEQDNTFSVLDNGRAHRVERAFIDPLVRDKSTQQINTAIQKGLLSLTANELEGGNDTEYSLRAHVNGKGGGPVAAVIGFWATKVVGYGIVSAGIRQGIRDIGPEEGTKKRMIYDKGADIAHSALMVGELGAIKVNPVVITSNAILNAGAGRAAGVATVASLTVLGDVPVQAAALKVGSVLLCIPWLP